MRRWLAAVVAGGVSGVWVECASAHLVSTELGPFYDGAAHVVVSPTDWLVVLVVCLLGALRGVEAARRAGLALMAGWGVGCGAGYVMGGGVWVVPMSAWVGVMLVLGVLVAADVRVWSWMLAAGAGVLGLLGGLSNGEAAAGEGTVLTVVGIVVGVSLLSLWLAGAGVWLERQGMRLLLRIAGSWVAAIGLLILGWLFRPEG